MLVPRSYQRGFCHQLASEAKRHFLEIWPRQHGKDRCFLNAAGQIAARKPCVVYHCFPKFVQGRRAIWENVDGRTGRRLLNDVLQMRDRAGHSLIGGVRSDEMVITFKNGSIYRLIGSDSYGNVLGAGPYVIGYSEWSRCDPAARDYFQPMIVQNRGIEAFMSTVFGENHCTAMADTVCENPDWHYSFYTIDETFRDAPGEDGEPVVSTAFLEELRGEWIESGGESGMSPEMIAQEYYNDRTGVNTGKVYGEELRAARNEGRICKVPHDPARLVHTFWDRGVHNRIWFAQGPTRKSGPWWDVIDCLGTDMSSVPEIVHMLRKEHRAKYDYGVHVVARDAWDPVPGHIESFVKQAHRLGVRFKRAPNLKVYTGISAAKALFPLCRFDAERCRPGLAGLDGYHYEYDNKRKRFAHEPVKDGAAHWADAFRYFAVGRPDLRAGQMEDIVPPDADIVTQLAAQHTRASNTLSRSYRRR